MDEYSEPSKTSLSGINCTVDQTWDGRPVNHDPININLSWKFEKIKGKPHKRVVYVTVDAPLFDDPEPEVPPGITNELWNYEVVELFFANDRDQYLEVEVGPHGHWICLLFDGVRKPFNNGEELELSIINQFVGDKWRSEFEIPLAYFPGNITKMNAYAIHGVGDERVYEAMNPVTDGTHTEPDFHRVEFFKPINIRRLIPDGYNNNPFIDFKYGDVWRDHK